jgi:hypothetical protein
VCERAASRCGCIRRRPPAGSARDLAPGLSRRLGEDGYGYVAHYCEKGRMACLAIRIPSAAHKRAEGR